MNNSFPRDGVFTPQTDYADQLPLNTIERAELKKSTAKSLNLLQRELN